MALRLPSRRAQLSIPNRYVQRFIENGKRWGEGLRTKNVELIASLYDEHAHYLPNDDAAIRGRAAITQYWSESMSVVRDISLSLETLEGTREVLYETGQGTATIITGPATKAVLKYKYVNVWRRQADGSYRVVIDTFNNLKPPQ